MSSSTFEHCDKPPVGSLSGIGISSKSIINVSNNQSYDLSKSKPETERQDIRSSSLLMDGCCGFFIFPCLLEMSSPLTGML